MRLPLVLFRPHRAASVTPVRRHRDAAPRPHFVRPAARPRDDRAAYKWGVAGIVILTTIIVVMSFEALSLALPTMMVSMRVGLQEISWTLTGYMISRTLFVGTAGWLGNRLGNRNLFALSLAVFTAGALLCGLAWRFEALVLFRMVQGMGSGPLVPLIMVILHETFPLEQRGLASVVGIAALSIVLEYRQRYHFQLLSQAQSQHPLEVAPLLDRLHSLFTLEGDWPEMVEHKALAVLNHRLHTEAAMQAYQECYLGLAFLYVLLFIPVAMLPRRDTVPERTRLAAGETP